MQLAKTAISRADFFAILINSAVSEVLAGKKEKEAVLERKIGQEEADIARILLHIFPQSSRVESE